MSTTQDYAQALSRIQGSDGGGGGRSDGGGDDSPDWNETLTASILVCGYTGCGKTSLIQAICGKSTVPDSAIGHARPETMDFTAYRKNGAVFWDSKGMELGRREDDFVKYVRGFVRERQDSDDLEDHVHVLWYCIAGDRARVTNCDKNLIRDLFDPVLVVVTKNDIVRPEQRQAITDELRNSGVPEQNIVFCSSANGSGLRKLLDRTFELMPEAQQKAFHELYRIRKQEFKDLADSEADSYIHWGTARAAAIAIIPIPLADMPMLVANQTYMICAIGSAYGYAVTDGMIASLLGTVGTSVAGMTLASFLPFFKIPIAAGITYGVGHAAKAWFENDMSASAEDLKDAYNKAERESKNTDWKDQAKGFDV
ncbi:MAG: DUF697 domain-containing protein [Pseudomonadota bacterium]